MIILLYAFSFMACESGGLNSDSANQLSLYEDYQKAYNEYKNLSALSLYAEYTVKGKADGEIYIDNETVIDTTQIKAGEGMVGHTKQFTQFYEKNVYDEYIRRSSEQFYRDGYVYIEMSNVEKVKMEYPIQTKPELDFIYLFDFDKSMIKEQSIQSDKYVFVLDEQKIRQEVLDKLSHFYIEIESLENIDFHSIVFSVALENGDIAATSLRCMGTTNQNDRLLAIEFSADIRVKSTEGLTIDFPEDLDLYQEISLMPEE
ncbi:MAG: hypothetical protein WDA11_09600 [Thiohalomonadaceae bacterium]